MREGIASLLERSPFEVVGLAGDVPELMRLVPDYLPGLVVLDIRVPPSRTTEGLDAAQAIRTEFPEIGILVLPAHVEIHRALDLLSEGRRVGYLLKSPVTEVGDFLEHQVLELMAQGPSNAGIARELCVSEGTVHRHVRSVLSKLPPSETGDDHQQGARCHHLPTSPIPSLILSLGCARRHSARPPHSSHR